MPTLLKLLFLTALLNGCGQTGPLYLPDAPPPIHTERQEQQPQPVDEQEVEPKEESKPTPPSKNQ